MNAILSSGADHGRGPSSHRRPTRVQGSGQAGFSLVEVVVALLILTIGILGLAGTTGFVLRQSQLSAVATDRSLALQAVIEQIKSRPFNDVVDGKWTDGTYAAEWTVTQGTVSKELTIVTLGPGMVAGSGRPYVDGSVRDTFTYRILRP